MTADRPSAMSGKRQPVFPKGKEMLTILKRENGAASEWSAGALFEIATDLS
jgi:hypothetical protein